MMCRLLGVPRSSFYACGGDAPRDPWAALRAEVERLWLGSGRRWGARTIRSRLAGPHAGATLYRVTVTWNDSTADRALLQQICASIAVNGNEASPSFIL